MHISTICMTISVWLWTLISFSKFHIYKTLPLSLSLSLGMFVNIKECLQTLVVPVLAFPTTVLQEVVHTTTDRIEKNGTRSGSNFIFPLNCLSNKIILHRYKSCLLLLFSYLLFNITFGRINPSYNYTPYML